MTLPARELTPGTHVGPPGGPAWYAVTFPPPELTDEGVVANVRYADGGLGRRVWADPDTPVPVCERRPARTTKLRLYVEVELPSESVLRHHFPDAILPQDQRAAVRTYLTENAGVHDNLRALIHDWRLQAVEDGAA